MTPVRTYEFIVVLKKRSEHIIDIISLIMLAISLLFFTYTFIVNFDGSVTKNMRLILFPILVLAILGWIFFCRRQKKNGSEVYYRFALFLAAWGWYMIPATIYLSAVYALAAIIEKMVKTAPEYGFDKNEIVFNSIPKKVYQWNEVSNVVLKFNMLTIDLKNNRIMQGEVNSDVSLQTETEFNNFCKKCLEDNI